MNWTGRIFIYILAAFLVYVLASGDAVKWKQLFSGPISQ